MQEKCHFKEHFFPNELVQIFLDDCAEVDLIQHDFLATLPSHCFVSKTPCYFYNVKGISDVPLHIGGQVRFSMYVGNTVLDVNPYVVMAVQFPVGLLLGCSSMTKYKIYQLYHKNVAPPDSRVVCPTTVDVRSLARYSSA